jgi:two-component system chemotaxis sensor kinase CheA
LELQPLPALGVGIKLKLIGLMVAMTIVVVCPLATYAPARQIREDRAAAHDRAGVYAGLASRQLRSAVAFEDRETAREVLSAIAKDPLIDGIAVYTGGGDQLHGEGKLSDLATRAGRGISDQPAAYYLPGRILATAPVKSLEGAQGTLVVELSTRPAQAMQRQLIAVALGIGSAALFLGAVMAWLIARSLSRRIEVLANAASAMSRGELEHAIDVTGPNDELGLLSHGFKAMSQKVSELVSHIQRTAHEENARLERLVAQRTDQLQTKNRDLRLVLDNVEQGFVTVDREARQVGEYSLAAAIWVGDIETDTSLWGQLTRSGPQREDDFDVAWEQVTADLMPLEITLEQMPSRLVLDGRHISLQYRPLGGSGFERMLVVMTDVTAIVARETSEQESRDLVNLTTHLLKDRNGFLEFMTESQRLVERVSGSQSDIATLKRDLHTLKGNTALYGLSRVSAACHQLETALDQRGSSQVDPSVLLACWERCAAISKQLLGERAAGTIEIDEDEYTAALDAVRRDAPRHELERLLKAWRLEPLRVRLERAAEQLVTTAASLGKGRVDVQVKAADLYLGREELSEFWAAFSHVVRNAAVHGLESCELREHAGKNRSPNFGLVAGIEQERLFVEIADTGPGIDWEGIRARASARGIPHGTQADLEEALFVDGVSTRGDVTELAGRGVGLSAVRAACVRQHGNVRVTTALGAGTSFRFSWPASEFQTLVHLEPGERRP